MTGLAVAAAGMALIVGAVIALAGAWGALVVGVGLLVAGVLVDWDRIGGARGEHSAASPHS